MSELFDDKKIHMSYVVSQLGAYPYKEIVDPFIAVFDNNATKEQIDEVEKHTKVFGKGRVAKAYDSWQEYFHPPLNQTKDEKERENE